MTLDRNKLKELGHLAREKKAFIRTSEDAVCDGARISPYPELDDILAELEAAEQTIQLQTGVQQGTVARLQAAEERVRELTQDRSVMETALRKISAHTCGCMSSSADNWHSETCFKSIAMKALSDQGGNNGA